MKKLITAALALSFLASTALAGTNQQGKQRDTSIDRLIQACKRLERNPQLKDFSAEILCRGHRTYWEHAGIDEQRMGTDFFVRAEVTMKGERYRVDEYVSSMDSESDIAECNIYREVRVNYEPVSVRLNSCQDLVDLRKMGRDNFCARHLSDSQLKTSQAEQTGRVVNTCK